MTVLFHITVAEAFSVVTVTICIFMVGQIQNIRKLKQGIMHLTVAEDTVAVDAPVPVLAPVQAVAEQAVRKRI